MVMQLVGRNIINLDKPVCEYLPKPLSEFPSYKDLAHDPRYRLITMRMLLDHTSGFPNWRWFTDENAGNFLGFRRLAYAGEGFALAFAVTAFILR